MTVGPAAIVPQRWRQAAPEPLKEFYFRMLLAGGVVPRAGKSRHSPLAIADLALTVYRAAQQSFRAGRKFAPDRFFVLDRLVGELDRKGLGGDLVECGVYRGATAYTLARAAKQSPFPRELWLFDSFQGLPEPTAPDGAEARDLTGKIVASQECARRLVLRSGCPEPRIHFVPGWFADTFPAVNIPRISLLHIDADFYEPVLLSLRRFYDALVPGGVVVLDDYPWYEGCRAALRDFERERRITVRLIQPPGEAVSPYFEKP